MSSSGSDNVSNLTEAFLCTKEVRQSEVEEVRPLQVK